MNSMAHETVGTNFLDASQAEAAVDHMLDDLPQTSRHILILDRERAG